MTKRIAILGATSHIAKGLIVLFDRSGEFDLTLFARNNESVTNFLKTENCKPYRVLDDFAQLPVESWDVVINCIVQRDPSDLSKPFDDSLFRTAEYFDNLVVDSLLRNPNRLYINISSGAAYGGEFTAPITSDQQAVFPINDVTRSEYYQAVKLYSEAKHRSMQSLNIVDIRVFAYFSRFIDLSSPYLLADMISCVRMGKVFETGNRDIVRDYTHPDDLYQMILACLSKPPINAVFDQYSKAPIGKFELLELFKREFGLEYRVVETPPGPPPRGNKPIYCSENRTAEKIGFMPKYTSAETVLSETRLLLSIPSPSGRGLG